MRSLDDPTDEEIEAATIRMYQSAWTGPHAPGEAMKEVWRGYARRCLAGFLEARRAAWLTKTGELGGDEGQP